MDGAACIAAPASSQGDVAGGSQGDVGGGGGDEYAGPLGLQAKFLGRL